MKTKYLVKFLNNSAHLDADLELVEIINCANNHGRFKKDNSGCLTSRMGKCDGMVGEDRKGWPCGIF